MAYQAAFRAALPAEAPDGWERWVLEMVASKAVTYTEARTMTLSDLLDLAQVLHAREAGLAAVRSLPPEG